MGRTITNLDFKQHAHLHVEDPNPPTHLRALFGDR